MAHAHCARQGSRLAVIGPVACEQVAGESWTALVVVVVVEPEESSQSETDIACGG